MSFRSVTALLGALVDYAGLFPPAGLAMDAAAAEFDRVRRSSDAWILGRFVVPTARLGELVAARARLGIRETWPVSVLAGEAPGEIPAPFPEGLRLEAVELRAADPAGASRVLAAAPQGLERYLEIPRGADLPAWIAAIAAAGGRAKIRCGGPAATDVPSVAELAAFLVATARADLAFKATAGLHHPLRGEYRLSYEEGAPTATMHGYLNLFLAAALSRAAPAPEPAEVEALLAERSPEAFGVRDEAVDWRGRSFDRSGLERLRASVALSIGSCSFAEPVDEIRALRWLP